ncbi:PTS lactose/cellobiose transporter subunit IIA [Erwinia sp. 9145]|uniref:PTS lactose/cellobiose transporter subunit IIA n=1 Tax=Erwinia sp. 9145 TaxID=1500895 RepID=UPI000B20C47B|nr:PTS lactose/cellobiose transporter subunit IIA [Erwinia sp. 9145]
MIENMDYEEIVMGIIVNAGQCKSFAFQALQQAKKGNVAESAALMAQSQTMAKEAHILQTQLIEFDEGEGKIPVHLIMVHAQDHLMTAMLAKELIQEIIELHQR